MDRIKEFVNEYKLKIILGLIAIIVVLMVVLFVMMNSHDEDQTSTNQTDVSTNNLRSAKQTSNSNGNGNGHYSSTFIDIEGAVKKPGVYQFTNNMRVDDAVNLAGGLNSSADRKHIDLAKKLTDQQTIYILVKGEIKGLPSSSSSNNSEDGVSKANSQSSGDNSGRINLNNADEKQLQSIDGIGEKRAEKIVEYRKSHGNFKQIDDVKKISGIGDKFFDNIKAHAEV